MPMGPEPLGFAYFAAVKAAGYTGYGIRIRKLFALPESPPSIARLGLTRLLIGIATGFVFGVGWWKFFASHASSWALPLFFIGLVPIRVAEWSLLLWLCFPDPLTNSRTAFWRSVIEGTLVSFALDVIGIAAAFVVPGGAWVC